MSRLLFVAAPNGFTATGQVRIRVLVVPQLDGGPLSDYGLQDWPTTLSGTPMRVRVKSAAGIRTAWAGPQHEPSAGSDAWRAFFGGDAGIAAPWAVPPPLTPDAVTGSHDTAGAVTGVYRASTGELAAAAPGAGARLRDRIAAWHEPVPASAAAPAAPGPPLSPSPDFHQAVALLREHPAVLRELGLIFELALNPSTLDSTAGGEPRWLSVQPRTALPVPVTSPWTGYERTADVFWPVAAGGIRHGVLDLSAAHVVAPADPDPAAAAAGPPPAWAIATFDIQGAAQGLRDTARGLAEDPDRTAALPGLRSAGLLLIRPDRGGDFARRAASARGRTAAPDDQHLTAEELTAGYRVDIRAGTESRWLSLCRRRVTYTVGGLALGGAPHVAEEGQVKPFAAVRQDGVLTADQVVLRWDGWSLVLPRVDLTGAPAPANRDPAVALPYDFRWRYVDQGDDRLPRLRFGTDYQIRVRVADLTGGGRTLEDVDGHEGASQPIVYTRHDPVRPPVLGGAEPPYAPGSALDRLVLRSDDGLTADEFTAAEPRYAGDLTRTLHRPAVSFEVAEQHGVFDAPAADEHTWDLARRALEPAGLPDPAANGVSAHIPGAPGGLDTAVGDFSTWRAWPDPTPKTLVLREETDPARPRISLAWDQDPQGGQDRLVVRLAKGERATLELSSRILPGMQDNFAWYEWLVEDHVPLAGSLNGRNPVVTPPRVIELVHAVRRPLADPVWSLPAAAVTRAKHATTAQLRPTFVSLDTDSTGRIEVTAEWHDRDDTGPTHVTGRLVHAETIERGAAPAPQIRHEFGDTRHRTVRYSIRAVSRFRHEFHPDEPDTAFERLVPQPDPVNIPSSAQPPAPQIIATVPSFHWRTVVDGGRIERTRTPRIRVELAGPWFRTGDGEQLAVITAAPIAPPAGSELYRDPLVAPPAPARHPGAAAFTAAAGPPVRLTATDLGHAVDVVPHAVHPAGGHWFADVAVEDAAYRPFARLAVARYQPDSLPGLWLSPIVTTDLVPLLPSRHLSVERGDGTVLVTLTGPGTPNSATVTLETCAVHGPAAVDLVAVAADDRIPAWRPGATQPVTLGTPVSVALPAGAGRIRLRVREPDPIRPTGTDAGTPPELTDRTAFFDLVEIPRSWFTP